MSNREWAVPLKKVAEFIVDKRSLFFLLFVIACIFSVFSRNWVGVENDISAYLPESAETKQAIGVMDEEFLTYGSAKVMIENITAKKASQIKEQMEALSYVQSVDFDESEKHYKNSSALFDVTFNDPTDDQECVDSLNQLKEQFSGYDLYVSSDIGDTLSDIIAEEMQKIIVIVAIVVVLVLLFTSQTYAEIPVLLLTFVSAALMNMGTNFIFGTISFISNSVTVVLQLALAIDYAIILCHRYTEEHETLPAREATIEALSKAIPEISSSSLTTISGLLALCFMQFQIGPDMGIVLIKAIFFSLLSVFTLMPGLLMLFSKWIDKTHHKNFVPKITPIGQFDYKTHLLIPPVFALLVVGAFFLSNKCPYVFGESTLSTPVQNEMQIAQEKIDDTFGKTNMVALVIPAGNYKAEKMLIRRLEQYDEVDHITGLSNANAMDDYMLTDELNAREFSELLDLDYEVAELLFAAYAVNDENYGKVVSGLNSYSVPLIDIFMFLYDEVEAGYVTLDQELQNTLDDAYNQMYHAKQQLQGEQYARMLVYLTLPEESEETFAFLDTIHDEAKNIYGGKVYVAGNSTSDFDLSDSFSRDNIVISILTALFVMVILLFTFKSAGMPVLLIIVIQGSIWINFSFPYLMSSNLHFMSYLIVSSIQMGANIDYAIVISSRYLELKQKMPTKDAMIETLNFAFPTILTSGSILAVAGIMIGQMTSEPSISAIGQCLGRGTLISIFLVLCVLPQILLLGDLIIEKTKFVMHVPISVRGASGYMFVR
ncbi:MAG: MMPL family transporter, partial [Clostridia bacterium]|nr:MMPL family transporter [Clostridia bacterium]